jgi:hypothetical protein
VRISITRTPSERAMSCAPVRSSLARLGDTPRMASTLSRPSRRAASASSTEESTPPENATPSGAAFSRRVSTRVTAALSFADHSGALVDMCCTPPQTVET